MKKTEIEDVLRKIADLASSVVPGSESDQDDFEGRQPYQKPCPCCSKKSGVSKSADVFDRVDSAGSSASEHKYGNGFLCATDHIGRPNPQNNSPTRLVLDINVPEGFIPLWARDTILRWRFNEQSWSTYFANPGAAKTAFTDLFARAVTAWGNAAPVHFTYEPNLWDFEIYMLSQSECNASGGCVLAEAFFPDGGRHRLYIYPEMFDQTDVERVDTLIHEMGHMFGLRHFFANISETQWPSAIFGTHSRFTIMNYGADSTLTETDKSDLRALYQSVWSGALPNINGTPIRLVKPYHTLL